MRLAPVLAIALALLAASPAAARTAGLAGEERAAGDRPAITRASLDAAVRVEPGVGRCTSDGACTFTDGRGEVRAARAVVREGVEVRGAAAREAARAEKKKGARRVANPRP